MQKTNIEWADYVWNPVTGCTKVSQGCKNCYAETFHHRFEKTHGKFTNVVSHADRLDQPLKVKKGGIVFVNSMSDLFHEDVAASFIYDVYLVMQKAAHHTFLILTKRPENALIFYKHYAQIKEALPNVWIGVSCEDQSTADERIPLLLQIPAAVRFLSCEPLLGPIDFIKSIGLKYGQNKTFTPAHDIHWVIAGGESGHKARPMHPDWARSLRDQCAAANVPFFFKQWGEWLPIDHADEDQYWDSVKSIEIKQGIQQYTMLKVGKSKSGALLDGKEHQQFPVTGNRLPVTGN